MRYLLDNLTYINSLSRRIPFRKCMGYQYWVAIYIFVIIITDVTTRFININIPWLLVLLVFAKYSSVTLLQITWRFSRKQSIVDLLSDYIARAYHQNWQNVVIWICDLLFSLFGCLYFAKADSLIESIILSCILNGLLVLYLICECIILVKSDSIIEDAARAMLERQQKM